MGNTKFCHFTTLENARNILSGGCFYLSKYNETNDLVEAALHEDEKDKVFILCLSHSESLNIPAFYLYGGIDGKGCRIQFTPNRLKEIIENCSISYVNKQFKKLKKPVSSKDYTLSYDWIYYIASDGYGEHDKKEITYTSFSNAISELKKIGKHYFVKSPIWKYEKEFRIIVKFCEDVSYDRIALNFDVKENEKGISVFVGPETTAIEFNDISSEFAEYGINKIQRSSENQISMNLIERNKRLLRNS